jgi:hypothetical protein
MTTPTTMPNSEPAIRYPLSLLFDTPITSRGIAKTSRTTRIGNIARNLATSRALADIRYLSLSSSLASSA